MSTKCIDRQLSYATAIVKVIKHLIYNADMVTTNIHVVQLWFIVFP